MSALSNRVEGLEVLLSEALSIVRPLGEASAHGDLNSNPWYRVTRLGQRIREALRPAKETNTNDEAMMPCPVCGRESAAPVQERFRNAQGQWYHAAIYTHAGGHCRRVAIAPPAETGERG